MREGVSLARQPHLRWPVPLLLRLHNERFPTLRLDLPSQQPLPPGLSAVHLQLQLPDGQRRLQAVPPRPGLRHRQFQVSGRLLQQNRRQQRALSLPGQRGAPQRRLCLRLGQHRPQRTLRALSLRRLQVRQPVPQLFFLLPELLQRQRMQQLPERVLLAGKSVPGGVRGRTAVRGAVRRRQHGQRRRLFLNVHSRVWVHLLRRVCYFHRHLPKNKPRPNLTRANCRQWIPAVHIICCCDKSEAAARKGAIGPGAAEFVQLCVRASNRSAQTGTTLRQWLRPIRHPLRYGVPKQNAERPRQGHHYRSRWQFQGLSRSADRYSSQR